MESLSTALATAWVLVWFAAIALSGPAAALSRGQGRAALVDRFGPAFVCAWLTIAIGTPLAAAVRGFNWLTALMIAAGWPAALWLLRHRGTHRFAFRSMIRSLVVRAVTPQPRRPTLGAGAVVMLALPLLAVPHLVPGVGDLRLPMPADFDTLWRTRQLLDGAPVWDPLAALAAVLTRLSMANALHVAGATRVALVALTAAAAGMFVADLGGRRWIGAGVALAVVVLAPVAPVATWAVALVGLIGLRSLWLWVRDQESRDVWHAVAAITLVVGQLVPLGDDPGVLVRFGAAAHYLEHAAAPQEALRLARSEADNDWLLVGVPELQVEIAREGHVYDLARFVSRYENRAIEESFRFDFPVRRMFVFVEKRPFEAGNAARGVQFVASQSAVYRVGRERGRLQRMAMRICDDYRRTHAGATIRYDDADLRVFQFDL